MDSTSALQLVALILLLVLSGFFSSAETSLTTISTIRLLSLAEQGNKRAQTVLKIRKDSGKMLSAILTGNNVVNLSALMKKCSNILIFSARLFPELSERIF